MTTAAPMSNADAAWLHMDQPTNLMVITSALWFDEPVDWDRTREVLRRRLVDRFPRFRQRAVEGRTPLSGPHWEDDPRFDLDLHLHRVALPGRGDRAALQALVADLMATPLDPSKPLWQWNLVDGYGAGSAIVARMHHCIADGIALSRVLISLTDEAPDPGIAVAPEGRDGGRVDGLIAPVEGALGAARSAASALAHEAMAIARHPSELIDLAADARDDAETLAKMLLAPADPPNPLRGELGVAQRVAWSAPISLDAVKEMGHATGTTVNDVVLTAVAGALRHYLRSRNGLVDELTAFIPFNLRPLDKPLPAELGNRFGLVFLRLPVGIGARRKRLAEIHRRMEEIKHSPEGALSYGLLEAIGMAPVQVERRVVEQFTAKATAVMTNVPGPRQPVYFAGTPVRGVLVWAPRSGSVPISVAIFSYAGEITVGLMVDAGLVPDPELIIRAFEREVDALLRLKI
ncbi:MAG TPA: wax ester/triacylglycerol synthase family O-acyltransferase [Solirubrobacterales bacterium]|nr:wax ester/triacylglycerol synthase family O-acyltransferase [Solirubrobacterales bacterium]